MSASVPSRSVLTSRRARLGLGSATLCLTAAAGLSAQAQTAGGEKDGTVSSVVVTGRKPAIAALSETIQNTPQSINVLPAALLKEQGVRTLQEALKDVPGITLNAGEGGSHGDSINLRGFPASDDFFLDGLRDTGFYTRDAFDVDALEIYKGPASTLFGRGSTGGVVNQVSKTPTLHPIDNAALTVGTNSEVRGVADVNVVLSPTSAFRLNAMGERSEVVGRDYVLNNRWGIAPSLAFGLGEPTTLTLNYLHQQEDNIPDYGIPFVGPRPAPVPRNFYYGLATDDRSKANVDIGTFKLTHEFDSNLSVSEQARYANYWFDTLQTAPHYGATPPTVNTPLDDILIFRDRPSVYGTITTAMSETQVKYKVSTGPLDHTLVAALDLDEETATLNRLANQMSQIAPTPLLDPNPNEAFPGRQTTVTSRPVTKTDTVGVSLTDTIDLGTHWELVGGARFDNFSAKYDEPITNAHFNHTDNIASPRAALVYKPSENQSFYFSYGTSYDPSAENLSLSARTADLGPEKDRTLEVGGKVVVLNGLLSLTAAAFNTEMTNARVGDPTNASLQILAGAQRVNGIELGASGRLTPNWEVIAGYTYLDARQTSSTDPTQVGQLLPNTAHHQANIWTTYDFDNGWKVGSGLNYLGQRAADLYGFAKVPSYVTWDGMIGAKINDRLAVQLNGYNLLDKYYFTNSYDSSPVENHVLPGAGRTITLTALVSF
jgi:catecholate siderophore receptor